MVWLSKPLGASVAVLVDAAQLSNTRPRAKRVAESIIAVFIGFSLGVGYPTILNLRAENDNISGVRLMS